MPDAPQKAEIRNVNIIIKPQAIANGQTLKECQTNNDLPQAKKINGNKKNMLALLKKRHSELMKGGECANGMKTLKPEHFEWLEEDEEDYGYVPSLRMSYSLNTWEGGSIVARAAWHEVEPVTSGRMSRKDKEDIKECLKDKRVVLEFLNKLTDNDPEGFYPSVNAERMVVKMDDGRQVNLHTALAAVDTGFKLKDAQRRRIRAFDMLLKSAGLAPDWRKRFRAMSYSALISFDWGLLIESDKEYFLELLVGLKHAHDSLGQIVKDPIVKSLQRWIEQYCMKKNKNIKQQPDKSEIRRAITLLENEIRLSVEGSSPIDAQLLTAATGYYERGSEFKQAGALDAALVEFEKCRQALKDYPTAKMYISALDQIATLQSELYQFDKAIATIKEAITHIQKVNSPDAALGWDSNYRVIRDFIAAQLYIYLAGFHYNAGQTGKEEAKGIHEALAALQTVEKIYKKTFQYTLDMGTEEQKKPLKEVYARRLTLLGCIRRYEGDNVKAKESFEKALKYNDKNTTARMGLVMCLMDAGTEENLKAAKEKTQELAKLIEKEGFYAYSVSRYLVEARIARVDEKLDEAIELLALGITYSDENKMPPHFKLELLVEYGECGVALGRHIEAMDNFRHSLEIVGLGQRRVPASGWPRLMARRGLNGFIGALQAVTQESLRNLPEGAIPALDGHLQWMMSWIGIEEMKVHIPGNIAQTAKDTADKVSKLRNLFEQIKNAKIQGLSEDELTQGINGYIKTMTELLTNEYIGTLSQYELKALKMNIGKIGAVLKENSFNEECDKFNSLMNAIADADFRKGIENARAKQGLREVLLPLVEFYKLLEETGIPTRKGRSDREEDLAGYVRYMLSINTAEELSDFIHKAVSEGIQIDSMRFENGARQLYIVPFMPKEEKNGLQIILVAVDALKKPVGIAVLDRKGFIQAVLLLLSDVPLMAEVERLKNVIFKCISTLNQAVLWADRNKPDAEKTKIRYKLAYYENKKNDQRQIIVIASQKHGGKVSEVWRWHGIDGGVLQRTGKEIITPSDTESYYETTWFYYHYETGRPAEIESCRDYAGVKTKEEELYEFYGWLNSAGITTFPEEFIQNRIISYLSKKFAQKPKAEETIAHIASQVMSEGLEVYRKSDTMRYYLLGMAPVVKDNSQAIKLKWDLVVATRDKSGNIQGPAIIGRIPLLQTVLFLLSGASKMEQVEQVSKIVFGLLHAVNEGIATYNKTREGQKTIHYALAYYQEHTQPRYIILVCNEYSLNGDAPVFIGQKLRWIEFDKGYRKEMDDRKVPFLELQAITTGFYYNFDKVSKECVFLSFRNEPLIIEAGEGNRNSLVFSPEAPVLFEENSEKRSPKPRTKAVTQQVDEEAAIEERDSISAWIYEKANKRKVKKIISLLRLNSKDSLASLARGIEQGEIEAFSQEAEDGRSARDVILPKGQQGDEKYLLGVVTDAVSGEIASLELIRYDERDALAESLGIGVDSLEENTLTYIVETIAQGNMVFFRYVDGAVEIHIVTPQEYARIKDVKNELITVTRDEKGAMYIGGELALLPETDISKFQRNAGASPSPSAQEANSPLKQDGYTLLSTGMAFICASLLSSRIVAGALYGQGAPETREVSFAGLIRMGWIILAITGAWLLFKFIRGRVAATITSHKLKTLEYARHNNVGSLGVWNAADDELAKIESMEELEGMLKKAGDAAYTKQYLKISYRLGVLKVQAKSIEESIAIFESVLKNIGSAQDAGWKNDEKTVFKAKALSTMGMALFLRAAFGRQGGHGTEEALGALKKVLKLKGSSDALKRIKIISSKEIGYILLLEENPEEAIVYLNNAAHGIEYPENKNILLEARLLLLLALLKAERIKWAWKEFKYLSKETRKGKEIPWRADVTFAFAKMKRLGLISLLEECENDDFIAASEMCQAALECIVTILLKKLIKKLTRGMDNLKGGYAIICTMPDFLYERGLCKLELGKTDEAKKDFASALSLILYGELRPIVEYDLSTFKVYIEKARLRKDIVIVNDVLEGLSLCENNLILKLVQVYVRLTSGDKFGKVISQLNEANFSECAAERLSEEKLRALRDYVDTLAREFGERGLVAQRDYLDSRKLWIEALIAKKKNLPVSSSLFFSYCQFLPGHYNELNISAFRLPVGLFGMAKERWENPNITALWLSVFDRVIGSDKVIVRPYGSITYDLDKKGIPRWNKLSDIDIDVYASKEKTCNAIYGKWREIADTFIAQASKAGLKVILASSSKPDTENDMQQDAGLCIFLKTNTYCSIPISIGVLSFRELWGNEPMVSYNPFGLYYGSPAIMAQFNKEVKKMTLLEALDQRFTHYQHLFEIAVVFIKGENWMHEPLPAKPLKYLAQLAFLRGRRHTGARLLKEVDIIAALSIKDKAQRMAEQLFREYAPLLSPGQNALIKEEMKRNLLDKFYKASSAVRKSAAQSSLPCRAELRYDAYYNRLWQGIKQSDCLPCPIRKNRIKRNTLPSAPRWKELYRVWSLFYLSVAGGETDFTAFQRGIAGGEYLPLSDGAWLVYSESSRRVVSDVPAAAYGHKHTQATISSSALSKDDVMAEKLNHIFVNAESRGKLFYNSYHTNAMRLDYMREIIAEKDLCRMDTFTCLTRYIMRAHKLVEEYASVPESLMAKGKLFLRLKEEMEKIVRSVYPENPALVTEVMDMFKWLTQEYHRAKIRRINALSKLDEGIFYISYISKDLQAQEGCVIGATEKTIRSWDYIGQITNFYHAVYPGGIIPLCDKSHIMISYISEDMHIASELIEMIKQENEARAILSVGIGNASWEPSLAREGRQAIGVDLSMERLAEARKKGSALCRADAHFLPFKSNSFDLVVFSESIGDMDLEMVLKEAFRLLRVKGVVIITTYEAHETKRIENTLYIKYPPSAIIEALENIGFSDVIQKELVGRLVFNLIALRGVKQKPRTLERKEPGSNPLDSHYKDAEYYVREIIDARNFDENKAHDEKYLAEYTLGYLEPLVAIIAKKIIERDFKAIAEAAKAIVAYLEKIREYARGKQAFQDFEKDTFTGKLNNLIQTAANANSLAECKEFIETTVTLLDKNIKDINEVLNILRKRIKKDGVTSSPVSIGYRNETSTFIQVNGSKIELACRQAIADMVAVGALACYFEEGSLREHMRRLRGTDTLPQKISIRLGSGVPQITFNRSKFIITICAYSKIKIIEQIKMAISPEAAGQHKNLVKLPGKKRYGRFYEALPEAIEVRNRRQQAVGIDDDLAIYTVYRGDIFDFYKTLIFDLKGHNAQRVIETPGHLLKIGWIDMLLNSGMPQKDSHIDVCLFHAKAAEWLWNTLAYELKVNPGWEWRQIYTRILLLIVSKSDGIGLKNITANGAGPVWAWDVGALVNDSEATFKMAPEVDIKGNSQGLNRVFLGNSTGVASPVDKCIKVIAPDFISSVTRHMKLPAKVMVNTLITAFAAGDLIAIKVTSDKGAYDIFEIETGEEVKLKAGQILIGALGARYAQKGVDGRVPRRGVKAGDSIEI
ncbi:MAG: hypothetical protein A2460_01470 [Omnitrophica WOR_2 bacterium RIFOXYC2_FULL_43_9]|nr:MAG: hypothetical protein A2460_01470 [Omnitrophica WOR_2 bacterium RIFOXYC2_FULL_43_9]